MQAQVPQLRQMTVADIIDAAIRIYRYNFGPLLGIVAVVQVPILALVMVAQFSFTRNMLTIEGNDLPLEQMIPGIVGFAVAGIVAGLLYPLGQGALAIGVSEAYLGRPVGIGDAYRRALPYWGMVFWTSILYWMLAYASFFVGILALIIGSVVLMAIVGIRYMLAPSVVTVLEGRWGVDGMKRSSQLTEGYFWQVFGTIMILMLMISVVTYGVTMPLQLGTLFFAQDEQNLLLAQLVSQAVASAVSVLIQPVWMIGVVLVYYDLRIRKEGFDLMMMAEAIGVDAPPDAAWHKQAPLYPQVDTSLPPPGQVPYAPKPPAPPAPPDQPPLYPNQPPPQDHAPPPQE